MLKLYCSSRRLLTPGHVVTEVRVRLVAGSPWSKGVLLVKAAWGGAQTSFGASGTRTWLRLDATQTGVPGGSRVDLFGGGAQATSRLGGTRAWRPARSCSSRWARACWWRGRRRRRRSLTAWLTPPSMRLAKAGLLAAGPIWQKCHLRLSRHGRSVLGTLALALIREGECRFARAGPWLHANTCYIPLRSGRTLAGAAQKRMRCLY